jgi:hypothetical protein
MVVAPDDDVVLKRTHRDRCMACLLLRGEAMHECDVCSLRMCGECRPAHDAECKLVKVCAAVFARLQRQVSLMSLLGVARCVRSFDAVENLCNHLSAMDPERVRVFRSAAALLAPYVALTPEQLLRAWAAFNTNSFMATEHDGGDGFGCLLFAEAPMFNHSCSSNASFRIIDGRNIEIKAMRDIAAGEEITVSYADSLLPRAERRAFLQESKMFWCSCVRCGDKTENGTFARAVRCGRDRCDGWLCALDAQNEWSCSACDRAVVDADGELAAQESEFVASARRVRELAVSDSVRAAIAECEALLARLRASTLHPRHSLNLRVRVLAVNLALDSQSDDLRRRAVTLCDEAIALMEPLGVWSMLSTMRQKRAALVECAVRP